MNAKELAKKLDGNFYGNEIPKELEVSAKENGLIVVFGASDDLCEFRGAIYDEADCYGGGEVMFDKEGNFAYVDDGDDPLPNTIQAIWNKRGYSWTYKTEIPHETFDIYEDEETYCQGIVFSINDLK